MILVKKQYKLTVQPGTSKIRLKLKLKIIYSVFRSALSIYKKIYDDAVCAYRLSIISQVRWR